MNTTRTPGQDRQPTTSSNDNRFDLTLSVSTVTVATKKEAKTVTDFTVQTFTAEPDSPELEQLFTTQLYSTNFWSSGCSNATYIGMTGVTLDYDHGFTIGEAQQAFADYNYILHTSRTHQHSVDGAPGEDRFRVILPFEPSGLYHTSDVDARKVYGRMMELYPQADKSCKNPGRKFFPSTRELNTPFLLDVHVTGKYYSVDISDVPDDAVAPNATPYVWDGTFRPESGLQKVLTNCPFVKWMTENISNPLMHIREPLKYGLITNLAPFVGGRHAIHEILKRDCRKGKYDPDLVDSKIENALQNGGPQKYTTLRDLGWPGVVPDWPASPAGWSHYFDTEGFEKKLGSLKGKARMGALHEHFSTDFLDFSFDRQMGWISRLAEVLRIDARTLSRMALEALSSSDLKGRNLQDVLRNADGLYGSPEDAGKLIFKWFTQNGGLVYRDREHKGYWIWEGSVYEIGNNQSFFTFMWKVAALTHEGIDSRKIWAVLKAETDVHGVLLNSFTWIHSDVNRNVIYLHLSLENEKIIRVTSTGVEQVENGANEDHVLLAPSAKMEPITLEDLDQSGYQNALHDFDKLVLRNMGCPRVNQLMYGAWCLAYPLIDYVMTKPNMRCDGSSESGKTRGTNLVSYFVYGKDHLKNATEAANYTDGASNPLVLLDNVEKDTFKQGLGDFLLMAATGITKEKRQLNTDRGTVQERVHCLVATTGVENLGKTEHINRTLTITFDRWKYKSPGWSERIFGKIAAERPRLVSAHMMLISKVLGRIADGELENWLDYLEQTHPGHAKNRANSFIGLMGLVLAELLPTIQPADTPEKIVSQIINEQSSSGRTIVSESNPIIMFLEAILEDTNGSNSSLSEDFQHWGYEVAVRDNTITGTAAQLHRTFSAVAKRKGMKYEYKDPKQLAVRIADTAQTLKVNEDNGVITTKKFILSTSLDRTKTKKYCFDFDVEVDDDSEDKDLQVD